MLSASSLIPPDQYQPSAWDEMVLPDGSVRLSWEPVADWIGQSDREGRQTVETRVRRLLRENGVTYSVHGDPADEPHPWKLDAVPWVLSAEDWRIIEAGLIQRAELLDTILTDLYGERRMVREGWLPAKLISAHGGYLHACRGMMLRAKRQLLFAAMDLARGPDGRMWVVNDRTQAPSGSGYVVENRVVMTRTQPRLFQRSGVRRIANFFRTLRSSLESFSPGSGTPRVVILTPGPQNETYYEQAFLASYLGYTLVQGDDLTVRDGKVWLASLGGLEKVDVIIRRVDAWFCDPLELKEDSHLGVPGLLEAIRLGNVLVVNHPGSGVLENPGLMAFLPGLARHFRGEELILPSAATWWCGEPTAREQVLSNLDRFVIKSIERAPTFGTVFGSELTRDQRDALCARIRAFPEGFVGQEQVAYSTVPCLNNGVLEARRGVMRGFVTMAPDGGYVVMPGGLTRTASSPRDVIVSSQLGGASKDTWVIGPDLEPFVSLYDDTEVPEEPAQDARSVPSRAGENLYWTGRYAERAEGMARLLRRAVLSMMDGFGEDSASMERHREILMRGVLGVSTGGPYDPEAGESVAGDEDEIISILSEVNRPGSLPSILRSFRNSTYAVRDLWSPDSWRVIEMILAEWDDAAPQVSLRLDRFSGRLDRLIVDLTALLGLNLESMTRDAGWRLLDSGRRIERAHYLIGVLRHFLVAPRPAHEERLVMESVLAANDSLVTYRKRYRTAPRIDLVMELLLLEPNNARSLLYQVSRLSTNIDELPRQVKSARLTPERKLLVEIDSRLRLLDLDALCWVRDSSRQGLEAFLNHMSRTLAQLSDLLTLTYFRHSERTCRLGG